jgi:DNA-binding PadR family transcriptional regulator
MFGRHAHREPRQGAAFHVIAGMQGERKKRRRRSDSGHLRLAILEAIGERPRDAQDVIDALTARSGGCYGPSAGFVYPMLSLLEDQGYIAARGADDTRRRYEITPAGRRYLDENQPFLNATSVEGSAVLPYW